MMRTGIHQRIRTLLVATAAAATLTTVFFAYLRPSFVVDLANRIALCF